MDEVNLKNINFFFSVIFVLLACYTCLYSLNISLFSVPECDSWSFELIMRIRKIIESSVYVLYDY